MVPPVQASREVRRLGTIFEAPLSLPVSTMSQWWVRRSSNAVVIGIYKNARPFAEALKLPRFRGHQTVCVQGVHDGEDKIALRSLNSVARWLNWCALA